MYNMSEHPISTSHFFLKKNKTIPPFLSKEYNK